MSADVLQLVALRFTGSCFCAALCQCAQPGSRSHTQPTGEVSSGRNHSAPAAELQLAAQLVCQCCCSLLLPNSLWQLRVGRAALCTPQRMSKSESSQACRHQRVRAPLAHAAAAAISAARVLMSCNLPLLQSVAAARVRRAARHTHTRQKSESSQPCRHQRVRAPLAHAAAAAISAARVLMSCNSPLLQSVAAARVRRAAQCTRL